MVRKGDSAVTVEEMKRIHAKRPFIPFVLRTVDGNEYAVPHPELMSFSTSGRTIAVATPDGAHEIIDLLLVTSVPIGNGKKNGQRKRKSGS
jgi:hypothetical protein